MGLKHKLGTMSSGQYDKSSHDGHGKGQKLLGGSAGEGRAGSTPHASGQVARDGVEGHGSVRRSYQTDAHGDKHHAGNCPEAKQQKVGDCPTGVSDCRQNQKRHGGRAGQTMNDAHN